MSRQRLQRGFVLVARVLGVGLVALGGYLATWSLVVGVPTVAIGLLFALRPTVAGELVDIAASLV